MDRNSSFIKKLSFDWLWALLPLLFLGCFALWPITNLAQKVFQDVTLPDFLNVFTRDTIQETIAFTFWQASLSAALTMLIGLPIAHVFSKYSFKGKRILRAFVVLPFVLPTLVVAAAFEALFERFQLPLSNTLGAIVAAHIFFNLAIVIRIVGQHWEHADKQQQKAAFLLGASPFKTWLTITLPQLKSVLISTFLLIFLFSFTSFGIIKVLGGLKMSTIETEIHRYAIFRGELDVAGALASIQIFIVFLLVLLTTFLRRKTPTTKSRLSSAQKIATWKQRLHLGIVLAATLCFIGFPLFSLTEQSFKTGSSYGLDNYRNLTSRVDFLPLSAAEALLNSLQFALLASFIAAAVGIVAAIAVVRSKFLGTLVEGLSFLPLGISAVTLGFGYLVAFTLFDLRSSFWIIPIAHSIIGFPFVVSSLVPALRSIHPSLKKAAATLGASSFVSFRTITFPLIKHALITGTGFAVAVSIGEFGASTFLTRGAESITAPILIFDFLSKPGDVLYGQAMSLSTVVGLLVMTIALLIEYNRQDKGSLL